MSVRVVVDSATDVSPEEAERFGIEIVPLVIRIGNEEFRDLELSQEEFWAKVEAAGGRVGTSTPSAGVFTEVFRSIVESGDEVVCLCLSSKLSGTYETAWAAAEQFGDAVAVIDSELISHAIRHIAVEAAKLASSGAGRDEVIGLIEDLKERTSAFLMLDTLDYIQRGGRIAAVMPLLKRVSKAFSIKPIFEVREGRLELVAYVRSRKKAVRKLIDLLAEKGPFVRIGIYHSRAPEVASWAADLLSQAVGIPREECDIREIGQVLDCHGGPGVIGAVGVRGKRD